MHGLVKEMRDVVILIAALPEHRQRSLARWLALDVELFENLETMTDEEFARLRELEDDASAKRAAAKRREILRLMRKLGWPAPPDGRGID